MKEDARESNPTRTSSLKKYRGESALPPTSTASLKESPCLNLFAETDFAPFFRKKKIRNRSCRII
jgi:hypothetical protein